MVEPDLAGAGPWQQIFLAPFILNFIFLLSAAREAIQIHIQILFIVFIFHPPNAKSDRFGPLGLAPESVG